MDSINRTRPPDAVQKQAELSRLIARTEESVSTGKSFNRPSEAPSAWLEISSISKQSTIEKGWASNIGRARILAQQAESTIDTLSNGAIRVRELMVLANNETLAPRDREIIALELESLQDQFNKLSMVKDNYGGQLFHPGDPIQMRIDADILVTPAPTLQDVFGNIDLGGSTDNLDTIMTNMINAVRFGTVADRADELNNAKSVSDHFATVLGRQGVFGNRLDEQEVRLQQSALNTSERRSALERTDVAEAISRFQSLLVNLEAAQRLYAKTASTSLIQLIG
ncbi:flagellin [Parasphingorhabdus sp. JC815]|uniref:flagellin n=1 Tax=Parasphingorhabdus sp. JC815 TaxID=3232140 RepID=UPI00345B2737